MKLTYLKEMVIRKVRLLIEGLPWNVEGYERVKNILSSKFGKPSELANAHIQNIYHYQQLQEQIQFESMSFTKS